MAADRAWTVRLVRDLDTGICYAMVADPDGEITDVSWGLSDLEAARVRRGDIGGLAWTDDAAAIDGAARRNCEIVAVTALD